MKFVNFSGILLLKRASPQLQGAQNLIMLFRISLSQLQFQLYLSWQQGMSRQCRGIGLVFVTFLLVILSGYHQSRSVAYGLSMKIPQMLTPHICDIRVILTVPPLTWVYKWVQTFNAGCSDCSPALSNGADQKLSQLLHVAKPWCYDTLSLIQTLP